MSTEQQETNGVHKPHIQGVLVAFSYSILTGSKLDPVTTAEVQAEHEAGEGTGRWSNVLFPPKACGKKNSFTTLRTHLGGMRRWTHANTYTFEDSLWRILPEKRIALFQQIVDTDGRARAKELLEAFIGDYENLKTQAALPREQGGRGDLYREDDYPDVQTIRAKFKYSVEYRPVPDSAALNPALMADAIEKLNALHAQRLQEANSTLVQKFLDPFKTLAEMLKDPKQRKMAPILDTIREMAASIPSMDLSGNADLIEVSQQVALTFSDITPEMIKKDEEVSRLIGNTCDQVQAVLSNWGQMGQRKIAA